MFTNLVNISSSLKLKLPKTRKVTESDANLLIQEQISNRNHATVGRDQRLGIWKLN